MPKDTLSFTYDVYALPSAQHRAGLAGLLILCDLLANENVPLPVIIRTSPAQYTFTWTPESLESVLNYYYDAELETVGKEGAKLKAKPKALFFKKMGMPEPWIRLWKDALYRVIKHPMCLKEYEKRAAGQRVNGWEALQRKKKGELTSSLMIGTMAQNAEQVAFQGDVQDIFLLQFWPLVMAVFCPTTIDREGNTAYQGDVIAIPDVIDTEAFRREFPSLVQRLSVEVSGIRPLNCFVSIPQEGALGYAANFVQAQLAASPFYRFSTINVEVYHLNKKGKIVQLLSQARLTIDTELAQEYIHLQKTVKNLILKERWVLNKLARRPWYHHFETVFSRYPQDQFVVNSKSTKSNAWIARQFAKGISQLWSQSYQLERLSRMEVTPADVIQGEAIEFTIFNLVREYVEAKTSAKTAIQKPKFKKGDPYWKAPPNYEDECQKICSKIFFRLRACKSRADFMRYFTDTLCSVPHGLSKEKYQLIASVLMDEDQWLDMKSLTMLALSKLSYFHKSESSQTVNQKVQIEEASQP